MAVVSVALGTTTLSIQEARQASAREGEVGTCVKTLAAVAGLCNDAAFESASEELPVEHRKVNGDATDTGLLRFAESILPVAELRSKWSEVAKLSFNSKVRSLPRTLGFASSDALPYLEQVRTQALQARIALAVVRLALPLGRGWTRGW